MIIINPETGHRFFCKLAENTKFFVRRNSSDLSVIYHVKNNQIVFWKYEHLDGIPDGYVQMYGSDFFTLLEVDASNRIKFYDNGGPDMPFIINLLQVRQNGEQIIYTEKIKITGEGRNQFLLNDYIKNVEPEERHILTIMADDFANKYPELRVRDLMRREGTQTMTTDIYAGFGQLSFNQLIKHRDMYLKSAEYREMVDGGFLPLFKRYLFYSEKTTKKHIDQFYSYLKGVKMETVPKEILELMDKYPYYQGNILFAHYDKRMGMDASELKTFKTLFRGYGDKAIATYGVLLKIFGEPGDKPSEFLKRLRAAITDTSVKPKKMMSVSTWKDLTFTIDAVYGNEAAKQAFQEEKNFQDWKTMAQSARGLAMEKRMEILKETVEANDYRVNCCINNIYVTGDKIIEVSTITHLNHFGEEALNNIQSYCFYQTDVEQFRKEQKNMVYFKVHAIKNSVYFPDFILGIDAKEKTSMIITTSRGTIDGEMLQTINSVKCFLTDTILVSIHREYLMRNL